VLAQLPRTPCHPHLILGLQVFPESADIKPNASATFRVAFRPPRDAAHFAQVCGDLGLACRCRGFIMTALTASYT
jgi:hypothetical protein